MNQRILIIEDEAPIRRLMTLALEASGYAVTPAEDGHTGLARFGDGTEWSAVLLDQRMPGLQGLDVLERVKARNPAVPVIMITAFASIQLAVDAMKLGAVDFLRKPVTPDILRAAVAAATVGPRPAPAPAHAASPPRPPDRAPIETLTMNGFRIVHQQSLQGTSVHRFQVYAGDAADPTPVDVQVAPEAVARVALLARRRFEPWSAFWQVMAENLLAAYLWSEQRVPDAPLVVKDVSRDDLLDAGSWPADL